MDALDNKPLNDQFYLGRKKNLSEIAAAGNAAQLAAIANVGLRGFRKLNDNSMELVSGAFWNGTAYESLDGVAGSGHAIRFVMTNYGLYLELKSSLSIGDTFAAFDTSNVFSITRGDAFDLFANFWGRELRDFKLQNVANTPTDANFVAPYAWRSQDIMLNLTSLTADRTITFNSADGWADGDWVNIWVATPNGTGYGITYTGAGTLTAANDESKLKQTNGAVSVKIDGTVARVVGKLKA